MEPQADAILIYGFAVKREEGGLDPDFIRAVETLGAKVLALPFDAPDLYIIGLIQDYYSVSSRVSILDLNEMAAKNGLADNADRAEPRARLRAFATLLGLEHCAPRWLLHSRIV